MFYSLLSYLCAFSMSCQRPFPDAYRELHASMPTDITWCIKEGLQKYKIKYFVFYDHFHSVKHSETNYFIYYLYMIIYYFIYKLCVNVATNCIRYAFHLKIPKKDNFIMQPMIVLYGYLCKWSIHLTAMAHAEQHYDCTGVPRGGCDKKPLQHVQLDVTVLKVQLWWWLQKFTRECSFSGAHCQAIYL